MRGLSEPKPHPQILKLQDSCYLNSSLQLLASSSYLQSTLPVPGADDGHAPATSPSLTELLSSGYSPSLPITSALNAILNRLWSANTKQAVTASALQKQLAAKNEDYDGNTQQDAHEALLHLLDQVRLEEVDVSLVPGERWASC
jgi:ubiquitin carboxyl-terminal hydrolase 16/45